MSLQTTSTASIDVAGYHPRYLQPGSVQSGRNRRLRNMFDRILPRQPGRRRPSRNPDLGRYSALTVRRATRVPTNHRTAARQPAATPSTPAMPVASVLTATTPEHRQQQYRALRPCRRQHRRSQSATRPTRPRARLTTCSTASCHVNPVSTGLVITPSWGVTGARCTACHTGANADHRTRPGNRQPHQHPGQPLHVLTATTPEHRQQLHRPLDIPTATST